MYCYKNKNIAVLGLGVTGISVVNFLKKHGANVFVHDDKIDCMPKDFEFKILDMLVISPGIQALWPCKHEIVQIANANLIPIINDIDLFQATIRKRNICITGTNGKSTTTSLINHILLRGNFNACEGGNLGNPVLALDEDKDLYVLELSSYQLESCSICSFDTAILLNITPDHLSRHGGMCGYIAAKQKIFANFKPTSVAIIGVDDVHCEEIYKFLQTINHANIIPISGHSVPKNGIGWNNNNLIDNRDNTYLKICEGVVQLEGCHNRQNIAASYAACVTNGVTKDQFNRAVLSFKGLPHRQELVMYIGDVLYINDSKATNADAVSYALNRFDNIVWILGGIPKEDGIISLIKYFDKIKYAFLIGQVADEWSLFLKQYNVENEISHTLDVAIKRAHSIAKKYGAKVILLSPACASFDQFKDYEERGDTFKKLVHDMKNGLL